jgi:hypothetical protein
MSHSSEGVGGVNGVPHDDEITWDAHDRIPRPGIDRENMPSRYGWLLFISLPPIMLLIAYLLGWA